MPLITDQSIADSNKAASRFLHGRVPAIAYALLSMLAMTATLWCYWPVFSGEAIYANGRHEALKILPWKFHDAENNAQLKINVHMYWTTSTIWRVVPDDNLTSIVVNNHSVAMKNINPAALRDWGKGFEFDFAPWLHHGDNTIVFTLNNSGGDGGVLIQPQLGYRWIVIWISLLPWLYALTRLFKLRLYQWLPICFAMIMICSYWSITPWTVRAHDVWNGDGHIDYVMRVADTLALPVPTDKWEFFQAPLYYIGGATVWRWAQWLHLPAPETLQAYSLLLWLIFLAASSATLHMVLRYRSGATFIGTTALALWPSGIIESIAINNDIGLYACAGVATYYMVRWWRNNQRRDLWLTAIFIALGLLTKTSAIALAGTLGLLMLLKLLRKRRWRLVGQWPRYLIATTFIVMGFGLSVGEKLYYYSQGMIRDWIMGNGASSLGDWLKVPAKLGNFIPLDIATFLSYPWAELTNDASGRANFWNLLLRSSLTGEFSFAGNLQEHIAYMWGIILLILFVVLLFRWRSLFESDRVWRNAPLLLVSVLWIGSLISLRVHEPYACSNDFRYVLPVIVPFIAANVSANAFNKFLLLLFSFTSAVFFMTASY